VSSSELPGLEPFRYCPLCATELILSQSSSGAYCPVHERSWYRSSSPSVGCALVRDAEAHLGTFSTTPEYLEGASRGIASGTWLHDFGLQTSRGFRALKVWMALKEHGLTKFGRLVDQDLSHARYLSERIEATPGLTLCFPTAINIVCFRYDPGGLSEAALRQLNTEIMVQMQEAGIAALSDTTVQGRHCLRAAINNHRTIPSDLDLLVAEVVRRGRALVAEAIAN